MFQLIFITILVVIVSGMAAAVEAALFTVPYARVLAAAEEKRRGSSILKQLKDNLHKPIMTLVIVYNVASIVGSSIIGSLVADLFGHFWIGIVSGILTFLIIVFSEIIPKTLGERNAEAIALSVAPVLSAFTKLLSPIIWVIERITGPLTGTRRVPTTSEEEIKALTKLGVKSGTIQTSERDLIHKVFQLNDITAWDMMTPWQYVEALDGSKKVREVRDRLPSLKHSRIPVYEKYFNKVDAVVHVRVLLEALLDGKEDVTISSLAHEAKFVPESANGDATLEHFQKNDDHLAVVVDTLGNVVGVLSLEDILEELVGEMIHEGDVEPERIMRVSKTEIIVDAETEIDRINLFFNVLIPGDGRIGELLLKAFGHIPDRGETKTFGDVQCLVEKSTPRRLEQVRIKKKE